jgi:hypothetical protein
MKKLFFLVLIVLLLGGGYYLWQHRYNYFFQGKQLETTDSEADQPLQEKQENPGETSNQDENKNDHQESTDDDEEENYQADIKEDYDCDQKCKNRKNTNTYRYCLEICGLSDLEENSEKQSDDCESLSGLDHDVCWKNKAIKEKNDSACNNINDAQLKKSCVNRVLEEIL